MGSPELHDRLVRRFAEVATMYAQHGAERSGYRRNHFYPIAIVCGDDQALGEHTYRMNGDVPDAFKRHSIFDSDGRVIGLLNQMNKDGHHKDGAMSFRVDDGTVWEMGVYIDAPHRAAQSETDYIREVTGEVGTRHLTALDVTICPGIEVASVVGQTIGEAMTFDEGIVMRDLLWVPGRYADDVAAADPSHYKPGPVMRLLQGIGLFAPPEQQAWHMCGSGEPRVLHR